MEDNNYKDNQDFNRPNNIASNFSESSNTTASQSSIHNNGMLNMYDNSNKRNIYISKHTSGKDSYNERNQSLLIESTSRPNRFQNKNKTQADFVPKKVERDHSHDKFKIKPAFREFKDESQNNINEKPYKFTHFDRKSASKNSYNFKHQNFRRQNDNQAFPNKNQYFHRNLKETRNHEPKGKYIQKQSDVDLSQRDSLILQLNKNQYECMICFSKIFADSPTWPCDNCFHIFHAHCINKWAGKCDSEANKASGTIKSFRCPACQIDCYSDTNSSGLIEYRCFCDKTSNPPFRRGTLPHSCGEVCEKLIRKPNGDRCTHLCSLLCHPGPCPTCEAIITRKCHCGSTDIRTKCTSDPSIFVCGSICGKSLNCARHQCPDSCHEGPCRPCTVTIDQKCPCDNDTIRTVFCGTVEAESPFLCGSRCDKPLSCKNHNCDQSCHLGSCQPCQWSPELIFQCWCGKHPISELIANGNGRQSCLDSVPSCGENCGKSIDQCGHNCLRPCHSGDCDPCPLSRDLQCRCGKSILTDVPCSNGSKSSVGTNQSPSCSKVCNRKLLCGRHRCAIRCCDDEIHQCLELCGRKLSCKNHTCERECGHLGPCPTCPNVSFDELFCECGTAVLLPPIACSQPLPVCHEPCSRNHSCNHTVRHNCHSNDQCPPCTELVSKPCPGGHKVLDNIPCFRIVATCGLVCGRPLSGCDHFCQKICHQGDCAVNSDHFKCVQPCTKTRLDCSHSCAAPCHHAQQNCESVMAKCDVPVTKICPCGLRCLNFSCSDLTAITCDLVGDDGSLSMVNLTVSVDGGGVELKCNEKCENSIIMSRKMQRVFVPSSYNIIQKYYAAYFEEFCRNNFKFVMEVEKIFAQLMIRPVSPSEDGNNLQIINHRSVHKFSKIGIANAKFIDRLCSTYRLVSRVVYDFDNRSANVTVEAVKDQSIIPRSILSQMVENKYFKFFKAGF